MSVRKNALIGLAIIVLCMLLITQLIGKPTPRQPEGNLTLEAIGKDQEITNDQPTEIIHLTATVHLSQMQFEALKERNDRFSKEHPYIQVQLENIDVKQAYTILKEHAKAGLSSDIMLLDYIWTNEFAASGYLSHELDSYIPMKVSAASPYTVWNGYSWAVPSYYDPYVMVMNNPVFQDYGSYPVTFDEWQQFQEIYSEGDQSQSAIYLEANDPYAFMSLMWSLGEEWGQAANGMYEIHTAETVFHNKLFAPRDYEGKDEPIPPLVVTDPLLSNEKWNLVSTGIVPAMIVKLSEWRSYLNDNGANPNLLLKQFDGGLCLTGTGYAVSADSEHQAEAFEWIAAMRQLSSGPDAEVLSGRSFSADPELYKKMEMLRGTLPLLYEGSMTTEEWNELLVQRWDNYRY